MKNAVDEFGELSLRKKAEDLMKDKASKKNSRFLEADNLKLIHELEVYQIELELQNDELQKAKTIAVSIAEKYTELFDFAPLGYFTISKDGEITEVNLIGSQMLGRERSRVRNIKFATFVSPDSALIFRMFIEKVFSYNIKVCCELNLSIHDNTPVQVYLTGIAIAEGQQALLTMVDITERNQVLNEIMNELQQSQDLIRNSEIAIFQLKKEVNALLKESGQDPKYK